MPPLVHYGNEEVCRTAYVHIPCMLIFTMFVSQKVSFIIASKTVQQTITTAIADSLHAVDIVHTIVFPEGRTLQVMVEYHFIPADLRSEADILDYIEHTIEAIQLHPSTDVSE